MGTWYKIQLHRVPDGLYLPKLKHRIEKVLETTDRLMSTYRSTSELSRFNASMSTNWQPVSTGTSRVIDGALGLYKESSGAFNPATGPLVDYWGFGVNPKIVPDASLLPPKALLSRVQDAGIELKSGQIRKRHPRAALDLNAIAKGDAIDGVARLMEQFGVFNYLIEIGGEIRTGGTGPGDTNWRVGLENPAGKILATADLHGQAIATSGDYIHFFTQNGKRYSHLIDPRLGKPVDHDLSLVSVVAASAMEADAWATALLVMGLEEGVQYAQENRLAALFLQRTENTWKPILTPAIEQFNIAYI